MITSAPAHAHAVETDQLSRLFGSFTAVDRVSLTVDYGEIFGFLGANGAGKTTAIRMLCGLLMPSSGNGRVAGFDIYRQSELIKQHISRVARIWNSMAPPTASATPS